MEMADRHHLVGAARHPQEEALLPRDMACHHHPAEVVLPHRGMVDQLLLVTKDTLQLLLIRLHRHCIQSPDIPHRQDLLAV